jgi:hypothetical protein
MRRWRWRSRRCRLWLRSCSCGGGRGRLGWLLVGCWVLEARVGGYLPLSVLLLFLLLLLSSSSSLVSNWATHASQVGKSVLAFCAWQMQLSSPASLLSWGNGLVEYTEAQKGYSLLFCLSHSCVIMTTWAQTLVHCWGMSFWSMSWAATAAARAPIREILLKCIVEDGSMVEAGCLGFC